MRAIEAQYGLPGTFSYASNYLDFEQYFNFTSENIQSSSLSICAVLVIILIITASVTATLLVAACVLLVDLFLIALVYFWGLTFSPFVMINIVIAIGLSVDYSAHIAHAYLIAIPPPQLTEKPDIRMYKTKKALSQMGSSVFHGGFSTFLAIIALSPAKSWIFMVFFKLWFGIICFGMGNGFLLLPVLLSFIGPTETHAEEEEIDEAMMVDPKVTPAVTKPKDGDIEFTRKTDSALSNRNLVLEAKKIDLM